METAQILAGYKASIRSVRSRAQASVFQLYYNDQTTDGWAALGPPDYIDDQPVRWWPLLAGDPRLASKPYIWHIGIDGAAVDGRAAPIRREVINQALTLFYISDGGLDNTTVEITNVI